MVNQKKMVSIISPCFNEEDNILELYQRASDVMNKLPEYDFEYLFIDNASTDSTVDKLKDIAKNDKRVKIIVNTRNFGHIRSPYWGILQTSGDATIYLASDLQDPPELIIEFIQEWEMGYNLVLATKPVSKTNRFIHYLRKIYYRSLSAISSTPLISDTTGFGLYDKVVINHLREINDPYPYLRGLLCELGYEIKVIPFEQPRRLRGISKNNFYTLYDMAILGVISHSLVPIRIASFLGFILGSICFFLAMIFFFLKLIFWSSFPLGMAPLTIGMFTMFGILLFFIGLLGEYVGVIHTYVRKWPIVVEKERINFD